MLARAALTIGSASAPIACPMRHHCPSSGRHGRRHRSSPGPTVAQQRRGSRLIELGPHLKETLGGARAVLVVAAHCDLATALPPQRRRRQLVLRRRHDRQCTDRNQLDRLPPQPHADRSHRRAEQIGRVLLPHDGGKAERGRIDNFARPPFRGPASARRRLPVPGSPRFRPPARGHRGHFRGVEVRPVAGAPRCRRSRIAATPSPGMLERAALQAPALRPPRPALPGLPPSARC